MEMAEEFQKELAKLNKQITDLETKIENAKKEKSTTEDLQNELKMMKQARDMMTQVIDSLTKTKDAPTPQAENTDFEDGTNDISSYDSARIKQIPYKILSNVELAVFLKNMQVEIEHQIIPIQKTQAALMFSKAKKNDLPPEEIGNMASLCWMNGYAEIALYLMNRACLSDLENPDNLNNLSAFLTMTGGEHLAIPILNSLDSRYPDNSTILNNMGQAWFGLGDMNNAKKYLERAVRFYAVHSQANKTLAQIYKSEGNTAKAVQAIKNSLKKSFSSEKESMLNDLGENMTYDEFVWKYPKPAGEPLGLDKFLAILPEYPMGVEEAEVRNDEWMHFRQEIYATEQKLETEIEQLKLQVEAFQKELMDPAKQYSILMSHNTPVYKAANRKLALFAEWIIDKKQRLANKIYATDKAVEILRADYRKAVEKADTCPPRNAAANTLMTTANQQWHDVQLEYVKFEKRVIQENIGYLMYGSLDASAFELAKAQAKRDFLSLLGGLRYEYAPPCEIPKKGEGKRGKLPDFDDVNCQYRTELSIPLAEDKFSIKVECNKMTTKFDLPFVKAELVENLNTNRRIDIRKGTVEISSGFSKEIPVNGPVKAELEAEVGAFVEFDNSGISDVGITGEAGVKMETQGFEGVSTEFGVGVRSSWNAGTTVSGTGIFNGSSVSFK